jgi:hypothetical protein
MSRKQAALNWTTIAIAIGAGLGTGIKACLDSDSHDHTQTVVASEAVRQADKWQALEDDLSDQADAVGELAEHVSALRVSVARLETAIEYLTKDRPWKAGQVISGEERPELEPAPVPKPRKARDLKIKVRKPEIAPADLEQKKAELF